MNTREINQWIGTDGADIRTLGLTLAIRRVAKRGKQLRVLTRTHGWIDLEPGFTLHHRTRVHDSMKVGETNNWD